jgi:hypothetical protein
MLNGSQQKGMSSSSNGSENKEGIHTHHVDGIEDQDEESKVKIKT